MQTRIGTSLIKVLALAALLALSFSCASYKDISVTSCEVASLSPNGLRAVDAVLSVGVHNPTVAFTLSDIAGTVRQGENVIATCYGGPVSVDRKSDKVYDLPCTLTLDDSLSLFQVLSLIQKRDFSDFTVDVSGWVTLRNGLRKKLEFNDVPVSSLLETGLDTQSFKL